MWAVKKMGPGRACLINENYDSYLGGRTLHVELWEDGEDLCCDDCEGWVGEVTEMRLVVEGSDMTLAEFLECIAREANEMVAEAANPTEF